MSAARERVRVIWDSVFDAYVIESENHRDVQCSNCTYQLTPLKFNGIIPALYATRSAAENAARFDNYEVVEG